MARRVYNPAQHPRILIFELFADLLIRDDQLAAVLDLTNPHAIDKLLEAETGFGKSKVLLPLWLLLTADKTRLAVISASCCWTDKPIIPKGTLQSLPHFWRTA